MLLVVVSIGLVAWAFAHVLTRPIRSEGVRADQTVLTVLHWGDKNEDAIVAGLVREFMERNPDIHVQRTNIGSPAQLATKLQTMLAAGDPPDVFYLESERLADFADKGLLADMDALIRADTRRRSAGEAVDAPVDLSDFFTPVVEAFRFDGGRVGQGPLYGLPKDFTPVGFYYNKDLFRRAGVPLPDRDGWTWEQFHTAAREIGKLPGCYGADFVTWEAMIRIYLFTHGLDFASPGFTAFQLTEPEVVTAVDRLRSWFHDEERTLLSAKTQLETGQEPFLAGNVGLAGPYGRWKVPTYRLITSFDWDFAPLPQAAGRAPANGVLTVAWAMSRGARNPDESWRLIKYLCGRAGQERICAQGLAVPVLKSVARKPCFSDPGVRPASDDVYLRAAEIANYIEWPADPRFRDQLKIGLEEIFKLGRPTQPALASVQASWESNVESTVFARRYPVVPWTTIAVVTVALLGLTLLIGTVLWWRNRPGTLAAREEVAGMMMVSPWMIGFALLTAFPIGLSLLLAFSRWNGLSSLSEAEWVGFDNFKELVRYDHVFRRALWVTTWYALLAVPSSQIAALVAALLLNHEWKSIGIFRAIWYLPSVLAGVGMAIMWKWVFHHEQGLLNAFLDPALGPLGAAAPAWFEKDARAWGVPAFAIVNVWLLGGTMMIYLAGLKGIPQELYEAASIDGATGGRRFLSVTLPMLSPVIFFNGIMAIIASFQIFTQVFVMTGGGPGTATHFFVFYIYKKAFDLHQMGYASAMAWLLLVIVLALTLLVMRGSRRFVYYEALKA